MVFESNKIYNFPHFWEMRYH